MTTLPIVNEQTSARLTITLLDYDDAQQVPSSVTYRVDDVATAAEIRDDAVLTPAGSIDITLNSIDNTIQNTALELERHRVTVKASYGATDKLNAAFDYYVRNLVFVT